MIPGETVQCVVDYDLFGLNINGQKGCFVKLDENLGKYLIWFPKNGEWAELKIDQFKMVNKPGHISVKFKEFISRVKPLEYSFPT